MHTVISFVAIFVATFSVISKVMAAEVLMLVDKTTQRMTVLDDSAERYS